MQTLAILAAAALSAAPAGAGRFEAASAGSSIRIHVAKRGAFAVFAHDHDFEVTRWSATAEIPDGDPAQASIDLVLAAGSLHDRERKLSEGDRRKVDEQAAGPEILDAAHAPEITYRSESVGVEGPAGGEGAPVRGTIHGSLTLRGRTRPVDAAFEAARDGDGWSVRGQARFRQSEFGIAPFSTFGGTVGVKDEVEVTFHLALRPGAISGPRRARASPPTR